MVQSSADIQHTASWNPLRYRTSNTSRGHLQVSKKTHCNSCKIAAIVSAMMHQQPAKLTKANQYATADLIRDKPTVTG